MSGLYRKSRTSPVESNALHTGSTVSTGAGFTGVKVFSATIEGDRLAIGERVTDWLTTHPELLVVDTVTCQSSDARFHCLSIILFYAPRER